MHAESRAIDPTKVAIYIRWSTEDQGEGTTLEVQSEACQAYLTSQGWVVNDDLLFIDDGWSGGALERPALGRLRRAVAEGLVDCVVVYKLDRLSRSVVDTVNLVCREWEGRCSVKSAREPIDTTTHAGRMFFYTLVNYAEWERSVIKERTYAGKLRRAREGRNPGYRPPYGYALTDGSTFAILPGEAAVVQRIYQMYLGGMGARSIVSALNRDGRRPRHGSAWSQSSVIKILSNPAYVGRMEYGRRRAAGGAPLVVREGVLPPIIARADWEAVQALKGQRPGFGRGTGSGRAMTGQSLLTGLLRCRCGHGFKSAAASRHRGGDSYRYYTCMGAHAKGPGFCTCGSIRQELVDSLVIQQIKQRFGGSQARERVLARIDSQWERELAEARAVLQAAEKEMERARAGYERIKRLVREGELTVAEYREIKASLDAERSELGVRLERARLAERGALAGLSGRDRLNAHLKQVDAFDLLDPAGQKRLLRHFIQEIQLHRPQRSQDVELRIVWRWGPDPVPAPPGQ